MPVCSYSCLTLGIFLSCDLLSSFDVFHKYRVCVINRVYLICSVLNLFDRFPILSLKGLSLGLRCNFHVSSTCGHQKSALRHLWSTRACLGEHRRWQLWISASSQGQRDLAFMGSFSSLWLQEHEWYFWLVFPNCLVVGVNRWEEEGLQWYLYLLSGTQL